MLSYLASIPADVWRRALTALFTTIALVGVNPLLAHFNVAAISDATIASVAGVVATYLYQSGQHAIARTNAAATAALDAPKAPAAPTVVP